MDKSWPATRETGVAFLAALERDDKQAQRILRLSCNADDLFAQIMILVTESPGHQPEEDLIFLARLAEILSSPLEPISDDDLLEFGLGDDND